MDKIDARKLSVESRAMLRQMVLRLRKQSGMTAEQQSGTNVNRHPPCRCHGHCAEVAHKDGIPFSLVLRGNFNRLNAWFHRYEHVVR